MASAKILAFSGSSRRDSFNRRALEIAVAGARSAGGDVTLIDLKDYPMPIMDQDIEDAEGIPEPAVKLRELMRRHDALLIASPEYNSSISPLLKNAIDWVSRPAEGVPTLVAFRGKTAALLAASPSPLGGLRGLVHVRAILGNIGVVVLPDQVTVPQAHEAFGDDGKLKDTSLHSKLEKLGADLVKFLAH